MNRRIIPFLLAGLVTAPALLAQPLSPKWEELTASDFVTALQQSNGVCLLPFGIVEKHGPGGPLGTDLINVRFATMEAVQQEYAVVFPEYYFGQIFEAKHQPGTIAYSARLQLELLQETTAEMARNGCKKIAIVNGHGGNNFLLQYFAQATLDTPKDYVVYVIGLGGGQTPSTTEARPSKPGVDGHAGESELASVMAARPELAHPERSSQESGANLNRLDLPQAVFTGIWWYARYPNHYQGEASGATALRGRALVKERADAIANAIRAIKADQVAPKLQKEFFDASQHPLDTKQ